MFTPCVWIIYFDGLERLVDELTLDKDLVLFRCRDKL